MTDGGNPPPPPVDLSPIVHPWFHLSGVIYDQSIQCLDRIVLSESSSSWVGKEEVKHQVNSYLSKGRLMRTMQLDVPKI